MTDGKELQTFGCVETNGKTSYTYKKPAGDDITIKITYPDGAREITLPLWQAFGPTVNGCPEGVRSEDIE